MRPPVDDIPAPLFPRDLAWVNVATLRLEQQRGRPVLIEFFDFCRPSCLRTMDYLKAWHERYADDGLRVISLHAPGFGPGRDEDVVRGAIARLGIEHPVALDTAHRMWREYDNRGWPARYLFNGELRLFEYHFGEGGYRDTEAAIQELLGVERDPLPHLHPEDDPDAPIVVPTPDREGAWSGPYEAGAAWAILEGEGSCTFNGEQRPVEFTGAHLLVAHAHHEHGVVELEVSEGVTCHGVCFTPGLAAAG